MLAPGAREGLAAEQGRYARPIGAEAVPLLEAIPLLRGLNPVERRALANACRLRVFERGETVFSEGERSTEFSFVAIGSVKIVKAAAARSVILRIVGAGGGVGLVAPYESRPYPASAVALVPSTIVHVPEREFFAVVDRHPEIVRQLLQLMMERQVGLGRRVAEMTGSVESRLARVLLDLADGFGRREGSGADIPLPLTRQDLADLAGTTVETAIRTMSRWAKEGLVTTRDDGFHIPDAAALNRAATV